jgi:Methyltransferase domain
MEGPVAVDLPLFLIAIHPPIVQEIPPMLLNLGAGSFPEPGWVNVDAVALPGIDAVHDLDTFPWPWPDGQVQRIKAYDVFEHVDKPLEFMRECWRVLEPGGMLDIHSCYWRSKNAFTDPTHKRACTDETWDYWVPGTYLNQRYGAAYAQGRHFEKVKLGMDGTELAVLLKKIA